MVADFVGGYVDWAHDKLAAAIPPLRTHPKLTLAAAGSVVAGGTYYYLRWQAARARGRAEALQKGVRVLAPHPTETLISLLGHLFTPQDNVETVRTLCLGERVGAVGSRQQRGGCAGGQRSGAVGDQGAEGILDLRFGCARTR